MSLKNSKKKSFLLMSIELEPTHYKTDLWNKISESKLLDTFIIYTQMKNWLPDGGHNYLKFPKKKYKSIVLSGNNFWGTLCSAISVAINIYKKKPDAVIIFGYYTFQFIVAILTCLIFRRCFLLFVDEFNNKKPPGRYSFIKFIIREGLRKYCFYFASAILVCGRRGYESAVIAGCSSAKIYNFPYVVDIKRIINDEPENYPEKCLVDVTDSKKVLFFSGRMIERKGLQTLLLALVKFKKDKSWVLWVEGDGPLSKIYLDLAKKYGIDDRCRFLGFCQYDLHSWLVRTADIVIVPSLEDNWGIVIDEALQLGKPAISSDATGSGYDRIKDKINGFIFPVGDEDALQSLLNLLLNSKKDRDLISENARNSSHVCPKDNMNTLLKILKSNLNE